MSRFQDEEEYEYTEEPVARPPRRPRSASGARPAPHAGRTSVQPQRRYQSRRARSSVPYMLMGLMGALVVGLAVLIVFLLVQRAGTAPAPVANIPPAPAVSSGGNPAASLVPAAPGSEPPRMPLAEFKALYDNPATRPIIVDVRDAGTFAGGHIQGAVSVPESDLPTLYPKIPKDKLVVAYCQ